MILKEVFQDPKQYLIWVRSTFPCFSILGFPRLALVKFTDSLIYCSLPLPLSAISQDIVIMCAEICSLPHSDSQGS